MLSSFPANGLLTTAGPLVVLAADAALVVEAALLLADVDAAADVLPAEVDAAAAADVLLLAAVVAALVVDVLLDDEVVAAAAGAVVAVAAAEPQALSTTRPRLAPVICRKPRRDTRKRAGSFAMIPSNGESSVVKSGRRAVTWGEQGASSQAQDSTAN